MVMVAVCTAGVAQKRSAFHLSLFPPVSSNGMKAWEYTNKASLSLLVGISGGEEVFSMAGLGTIVRGDISGLPAFGPFHTRKRLGRGFHDVGTDQFG